MKTEIADLKMEVDMLNTLVGGILERIAKLEKQIKGHRKESQKNTLKRFESLI